MHNHLKTPRECPMVASHRGDQKIGGKDVRIKKSHIGQEAGNTEPEMVREHELVIKVSACIFSSPVGSLCHTHGVVRRPSSVVRRPSYVVCRLCPP